MLADPGDGDGGGGGGGSTSSAAGGQGGAQTADATQAAIGITGATALEGGVAIDGAALAAAGAAALETGGVVGLAYIGASIGGLLMSGVYPGWQATDEYSPESTAVDMGGAITAAAANAAATSAALAATTLAIGQNPDGSTNWTGVHTSTQVAPQFPDPPNRQNNNDNDDVSGMGALIGIGVVGTRIYSSISQFLHNPAIGVDPIGNMSQSASASYQPYQLYPTYKPGQ